MTHFRLYLLTPQFSDGQLYFIQDQISEFYSQADQNQSRAVTFIPDVSTETDIANQRKLL